MSIVSKLQKISIVAGTVLGLGAVAASAGGLPQYEAAGFPISPHQITVLGLGDIQEDKCHFCQVDPHPYIGLQRRSSRPLKAAAFGE